MRQLRGQSCKFRYLPPRLPSSRLRGTEKDFFCIGIGRVEPGSVVDRALVLKRES
jgi:hypothetical protein